MESQIVFSRAPIYSHFMIEFDEVWKNLLDNASFRAVQSGRSDVADYLCLKLENDAIRRSGVDWLSHTLIELASDAQQTNPNLLIERVSPHSFKAGTSTMVGGLTRVQYGLRCLTLEAGWARTPAQGIMRNGGLAQCRFTHFGIPLATSEYMLVRGGTLPIWVNKAGEELKSCSFQHHLAILLSG
jgi:hypothetical protein